MKKIAKVLIAVLAVVLVLEGLIAFDVIRNPLAPKTPVAEYGPSVSVNEVLEESLHKIGELYTMEYSYTMLSTTTNPLKVLGIEMPVGEKKLSYQYSGDLRVGVDLAEASVKKTGNVITITFPQLIAHNTYDEDSVEFYDVKQYSFNKTALEAYQASRVANEEDIKKKAEAKGIYDKAKENLAQMMDNQVQTILALADVEEKYEVRVVVSSEEVNYT